MTDTYQIKRYYSQGQPTKIIMEGLSLTEAQEHCKNPTTRKEGEWFDGYTKE